MPVHGTDHPEEELDHTGQEALARRERDLADRTDPVPEEAGNRRTLHQWEVEATSTGFGVRGAEASPTESDQWPDLRKRSAGFVGQIAGSNQEVAGHQPEEEEVQKVEGIVHVEQDWADRKLQDWAAHKAAAVEEGTAAEGDTAAEEGTAAVEGRTAAAVVAEHTSQEVRVKNIEAG